jgi:hypothetical protein
MTELLLLRAEDADDLKILSACVQDMAVKALDVAWEPARRRLVLLGNRYRWEARQPTRVRSALRFDGVLKVARREWPEERHAVLPLLTVAAEGEGALILSFGGGAALRLEIEAIDATLEDVSGAWGALAIPRHGGVRG